MPNLMAVPIFIDTPTIEHDMTQTTGRMQRNRTLVYM